MRTLLLAVFLTFALGSSASAAEHQVLVGNYFFRSDYTKVALGDTVKWTLASGSVTHTVTSRGGPPQRFDSNFLDAGQSFSQTFTKPGLYLYHCELHPDAMKGVIQVGPDKTRPRFTAVGAKRGAKVLRVLFRVSEWTRVRVVFTRDGKRVRSARTRLLRDGRHAVKLAPKRLRPGSYVAKLVATDPSGNSSHAKRVRFKVPS